jgi:hypothetical protein
VSGRGQGSGGFSVRGTEEFLLSGMPWGRSFPRRTEFFDMAEQQHDIWFDRNSQYSLAQFHEDLATKII